MKPRSLLLPYPSTTRRLHPQASRLGVWKLMGVFFLFAGCAGLGFVYASHTPASTGPVVVSLDLPAQRT